MGAGPSSIDSEGGTFTISVESDHEWSAAFAEAVSNWELDTDTEAGLVNVIAGANTGGTISGTVVITAGSGSVTNTEEVHITQISRDDNPYFRFLGDWDIYSSDCYYELEWLGEGVNCMMGFAEYDYANAFMSFVHWDGDPDLETDDLSYDPKTGKVTMPLGSVAGSFISWYETYYMYFVALNPGMTNYSTTYYLEFTLSEDGSEISVSGLDDSYPVLGFIAYNENSTTFSGFSDLPYCKFPMSLTKASTKSGTSAVKTFGGVTFSPVGELPDGVPARLPKTTGEIHNML
ncbi:MAG: BACON domain-containing protein [Bacteroidales bacterium]|nr:BACON domain-containing protein [Bacteroidales bacterium]